MSESIRKCAACQGTMLYMKRENMQLGKTSLLFGDWPNLLAGALEVDIWVCPDCGKLEFYLVKIADAEECPEDHMMQIVCPQCGYEHDLDDPKCPRCGSKNLLL